MDIRIGDEDVGTMVFELVELRISDGGVSGINADSPGRLEGLPVSDAGSLGASVAGATRVSNSTFIDSGSFGVCEGNMFSVNGDAAGVTAEEGCAQ